MPTKLIITIDTEPDNQWDPALRANPRFQNIYGLNRLQKLFDRFKAKPTYLVSYSVVKSDAVNVLKNIKESSDCEIGTHLHSWETPPLMSPLKGDGTYLHQYTLPVQKEKFSNIDTLITDTFRQKQASYRAGRYSFDKNTLPLLAEYGYLVDTSVTPGVSWENDGGTNFKKFICQDSFLDPKNCGELLEVPVSIKIRTKAAGVARPLYLNTPNWLHTEGILRRITGFDIIWLDPSFNTYDEMRWASDLFLEEEARFLNIMFHSSVVTPGTSPYVGTEQEAEGFYERLGRILEYLLVVKKLESITLREYYYYRRSNN